MLTESMMGLPLYNDMASIIFGLYEDNDERLPYSLFVVGIDKNEVYIFTSVEYIECGDQKIQTTPYREWVKDHLDIQEIPRRSILHYEPYIASCKLPDSGQMYDEAFFKSLFGIKKMELLLCWHIYNNSVYILLYKDDNLIDHLFHQLMMDVCERAVFAWRDFFTSNSYKNTLPPNIDISEIIESLDYFREIAPYFATVTKISSLFYEKTRSKGSIAIMRSRRDIPLILFSEEETLFFSYNNAKQLRKLLETTRSGLSLLVYDGKVYGIGEPIPVNNQYKFNLTGYKEWNIFDHSKEEDGIQILRYKQGDYYFPTVEIKNWYIRSKIKNKTVLRTVNYLLKEKHMKAFKHGAILIITDKAKEEVERLCELNRGLRIEPISMMSHFKKACALCAIDGALFLDKEGDCHGIGIILDGEATVKGTPIRGSRYNSTKTYISQCVTKKEIEAFAIIISTDGYLDILTTHDEEFKSIKDVQRKEEAGR